MRIPVEDAIDLIIGFARARLLVSFGFGLFHQPLGIQVGAQHVNTAESVVPREILKIVWLGFLTFTDRSKPGALYPFVLFFFWCFLGF